MGGGGGGGVVGGWHVNPKNKRFEVLGKGGLQLSGGVSWGGSRLRQVTRNSSRRGGNSQEGLGGGT